MTGSFDGDREHTLELGAGPGLATGSDFASLGNKAPQKIHIFKINVVNLLGLEFAKLAFAVIKPATRLGPVSPARRTISPRTTIRTISGSRRGPISGSWRGSISGSRRGSISGSRRGPISGSWSRSISGIRPISTVTRSWMLRSLCLFSFHFSLGVI